jgi:aminoglycoside/choline kinase family phosphotransferase
MPTEQEIAELYSFNFGKIPAKIERLPRSGSDRVYFRIFYGEETVIAAYNPVFEENEAFVGFTNHFAEYGLPVPKIYLYLPEKHVYFLRDLGAVNLYAWLRDKEVEKGLNKEVMAFYKKVLDKLLLFQTEGVKELDTSLCYPHKRFDRQSMLWDMNYFKYMYLKLLAVPFNEALLEKDFEKLINFLLEAGQDSFLYRDFQTANIMVVNAEPWFIDYQGGRLGAPQYDLASLLYDAKIKMKQSDRELLLEYYTEMFQDRTGFDKQLFESFYSGFSLVRVMQACGAFGFRGLYERKPTFTESVVPGGNLLNQIVAEVEKHIKIPELAKTIGNISKSTLFIELSLNIKTL